MALAIELPEAHAFPIRIGMPGGWGGHHRPAPRVCGGPIASGQGFCRSRGIGGGSSASRALAATTFMLSMINAGLGKHGGPVLAAFAAYLALGEVSEASSVNGFSGGPLRKEEK